MSMSNKWYLAGIAAAATLVLRFTLYREDCNLLVLVMTFLILFSTLTLATMLIRKLRS